MASQKVQYVTADVFTKNRYEGNQLAIVRVPASVPLSQEQKQSIAREFNYSETVILHESEESYRKSEWTINIFLTTAEIPLAGHPVVGTACYLGSTLQATGAGGDIRGTMHTKAGKVPFTYSTTSKSAAVEIPHDSFLHNRTLDPTDASQYGIPSQVCKSMVKPAAFVSIVKGMTFCLVELASLDALGQLKPELKAMDASGLDESYVNKGFIGFFFYVRQGKTDDGTTRLRTRMISENLEDAATGSASSAAVVYLALHDEDADETGDHEQKFELTQGVEMGRKSVIGVTITGDRASKRVEKVVLSGSSVEVMEGSLHIPA